MVREQRRLSPILQRLRLSLCHIVVLADAGATQADMEEISNQILDLYERGAAASIRPALGKENKDEGVAEQARKDRAAEAKNARAHRPY